MVEAAAEAAGQGPSATAVPARPAATNPGPA